MRTKNIAVQGPRHCEICVSRPKQSRLRKFFWIALPRYARNLGFALLAMTMVSSNASIENERETLARLVRELRAIEPLVREAEQQKDPTSRAQFQYGWLKQDFEKVISGIEEYIHNPRVEPRQVEPLRGDYRR